jgi:hypothetical protein
MITSVPQTYTVTQCQQFWCFWYQRQSKMTAIDYNNIAMTLMNKMKNKTYYTVGIFLKSIRK